MFQEYSELTSLAIDAALLAGSTIVQGIGTKFSITDKGNGSQNYATEYDLKADQLIKTTIKERFPEQKFLTEESGSDFDDHTGVIWIVDPIDGTRMYTHNICSFCVSIGCAIDGVLETGVIYIPTLNELFVAERAKGAFLNNIPIKVSDQADLNQAMLATDFPYNVTENPGNCIDVFAGMVRTGTPTMSLGAAAMELAYVAAGRFDGYFCNELQAWDIAAARLLIEEAGGNISNYDGQTLDIFAPSTVVASNRHLHEDIRNTITSYRA